MKLTTKCARWLILLAIGLLPSSAAAQAGDVVEVPFTHLGSTGDRHFDRNLNVGQTLKVVIKQTCDAFDLDIRGVVRGEESGPTAQASDALLLKDREITTRDRRVDGSVGARMSAGSPPDELGDETHEENKRRSHRNGQHASW
jgi:hypothetical protein